MAEDIQIKYCRHCGLVIPVQTVNCGYCGKCTIKGEESRQCPFCKELIKAGAVKCKHCGEFLDGRQAGAPLQQMVLNIEKAVIAARDSSGDRLKLYRPDGTELSLPAGELARLAEASQRARALLPGEQGAQPERMESTEAKGIVCAEPVALDAEVESERQPPEHVPEPQYECDGCGRFVCETDSFCENCGRDLSLAPGETSIPRPAERYRLVPYAMLAGFSAPVGFLLPHPFTALLAVAGALLGAWCLVRILASRGRLCGVAPALGAMLAGIFWGCIIAL